MSQYDKGRYYWIKLTDRFMTSDTVDFLMSQKDGANYVVLYQMLCLKTVNNNGVMARTLGEVIVPFDIEKIQRDCKWFSHDTVRVALELYKKLGLIYENNDGVLAISNFDRLIGSQTYGAEKKELQRLESGQKVDKCPPEKEIKRIRDKEIREEDIKEKKEGKKHKVFVPPTFEEVLKYAKEKGREDLAKEFFDYFTVGDWIDSQGTKVKNWKQKFLTWVSRNPVKKVTANKVETPKYSNTNADDAMERAWARAYETSSN
jgi:hypothetical protein